MNSLFTYSEYAEILRGSEVYAFNHIDARDLIPLTMRDEGLIRSFIAELLSTKKCQVYTKDQLLSTIYRTLTPYGYCFCANEYGFLIKKIEKEALYARAD